MTTTNDPIEEAFQRMAINELRKEARSLRTRNDSLTAENATLKGEVERLKDVCQMLQGRKRIEMSQTAFEQVEGNVHLKEYPDKSVGIVTQDELSHKLDALARAVKRVLGLLSDDNLADMVIDLREIIGKGEPDNKIIEYLKRWSGREALSGAFAKVKD